MKNKRPPARESAPKVTRLIVPDAKRHGFDEIDVWERTMYASYLENADKQRLHRLLSRAMRLDLNAEDPEAELMASHEAAFELLTLASGATEALAVLARANPDILIPFARKSALWPSNISNHKGIRDWNKWLLKRLQVGRDSISEGQWNPKSRATRTALLLLDWLMENNRALGLPALTSKTREAWFEKGWDQLRAESAGHPERNEYLRQIGVHREKHSERSGAQKKAPPKTSETNIQGGIRKQVWQSFQNITKGAPQGVWLRE